MNGPLISHAPRLPPPIPSNRLFFFLFSLYPPVSQTSQTLTRMPHLALFFFFFPLSPPSHASTPPRHESYDNRNGADLERRHVGPWLTIFVKLERVERVGS